MNDMIRIHPADNVAVALREIAAGAVSAGVTAQETIPQGHKMALRNLVTGDVVTKYGFAIGEATEAIAAGQWVHSHNMKTRLSGEEEYVYHPRMAGADVCGIGPKREEPKTGSAAHGVEPTTCAASAAAGKKFLGYRRSDGSVGVRNEIWILPIVGCVADVAKALAADCQDLVQGSIDGVHAFSHPYGCSQTGEDHAQTRKLLAALAKHPNAGAVLVLGLGCENLTMEQFLEELGEYDPERVKCLICQEAEDEMEAGRALLAECAAYAGQFVREEIPVSELVIGLKCGGSDGLSGITANPTVGRFSDLLIAAGGSTVLTEVPEMFGAEGMLMDRCINREVFEQTVAMINRYKRYFLDHHEVVYENPSPGNKAGGITTLEEKSCGCLQKGGLAPVMGVLDYGDRVTKKGLNLLYGPGNDLVSATALTAAGAQIILFTTGRGTPFGAPAPTVKIATNSALAGKKAGWIDFDAGRIAEGMINIEEAGAELLSLVRAIASGKLTRAEESGYREIAIFKDGVTL